MYESNFQSLSRGILRLSHLCCSSRKVRYTSFVKEISILTCDEHYRVSQESPNVETTGNKGRRIREIDMASTSSCSGLVVIARLVEKWRNNGFGDIFNKDFFCKLLKKRTCMYICIHFLRSIKRLMVFISKAY